MALSPGTKRHRNEKRDENRRSRLADAGRKNGNDLFSLWKKPRGSDMTASSSANRDTLDHRRRESELDRSVLDAVTSRPVIDVTTDDEEEASHTAAAAAAAAPASVLAPAPPNKPGRQGKGKGKGKAPPSTLENRDISRDLEEARRLSNKRPRRLSNKRPRRLGLEGEEEEEAEEEEVGAGAPDEGGDQRESLLRQLDTRPDWFLNCERGEATPENIDRARRLLIEQPDSLLRVVNSATNKAIYRGKETKTSQLTDQALREVVRSTGLREIGLVKLLAANDGRPSAVERRLMDAATTEGVFGLLRVMTEDGAQLRLHEGTDVFHPDVMSSYDGVIVIHELACGQFRRRQFDDPCATVLTGAVWRSWCAVSPLASPQVTYNRSGGGCAKDAQPTKQNTRLEGRCTPTARYTQQVRSTLDTVDRAVVAAAAKSWPNRRAIAIMQSGDVGPSNADQQIRACDISSQHNLPAGSVWSVRVNHLSLDLGQDTKPAESTARGLVNLSEATRLPGEEGLSRGEKEVAIGDLMLRFGMSFAEKEARVPGEEDVAWSTSHRQRVDRMRGGYGGGLENARTIMAEVGPELLRKKTLGLEERRRGGRTGARTATVDGVKVLVPKAVMEGSEAPTRLQQRAMDQLSEDSARGGATLGTGANQVGSAPSDGAAARVRKPIPGQPNPLRAHGFCFGFGADGVGLAQKLYDKFAGENGVGVGPILEGGCETPKFSKAGVTKGKSKWELDEHDDLILPPHSGNKTEGHPTCTIGGCVSVEEVHGSWRLCQWALPYVLTRKIVQKGTQNERHNGAPAKWSKKRWGSRSHHVDSAPHR